MVNRRLASAVESFYKQELDNDNIVLSKGKTSQPPKGLQMKSIDPHMHTVEHILNQTVVRILGCDRCFSAHIEKKKSKCDYRISRPPTPDLIQAIETQVNQIVQEDLEVRAVSLPREEAARQFNLQRLPADAGDSIRIILVGDYDACPCIGDHVARTGELGAFRITSWDVSGDVMRLRFKLNRPATDGIKESP